jgi:hypothetical protein
VLFRKKIEPLCAYCGRGIQLNETQVLCRKQGVVPLRIAAARFRTTRCAGSRPFRRRPIRTT